MTVTLKKLSICECGYPVLRPDITLGSEYEVWENITGNFTFICGGCGKTQKLTGVFVTGGPNHKAGFLPRQIFFPDSETETKNKK